MSTPKPLDLIKAIRRHAASNYETGGWDYLVECWGDAEILEVIGDCRSLEGAIRILGAVLGGMDDYRRDVEGA